MNDEPDMADAQVRMATMALQLAKHFGPLTAACLLSGAALTVLRANYGSEAASNFFAGVADEIGADPELKN